MKPCLTLIFVFANLILVHTQPVIRTNLIGNDMFPIVSGKIHSEIYYDTSDYETVIITAKLLAEDIERVSGKLPKIISDKNELSEYIIIVGSVEKNVLIHSLSTTNKMDIGKINGHWEQFYMKTLNNPFPGVKKALVIAGSDRRGTAYGVFELSKAMGVSPWYWWADVTPERKTSLNLEPVDYISNVPSVKYRGIFLNDEDWGLQPWAAKTFEPETGDIGPKTYAKIFELLLRLKANLIWPAMHSCTKAFYYYPGNKLVADAYGIVVGSSHAEPMLRDNVDEWIESARGDFNYVTNSKSVYNYWDERARESKNYENIYTVGMRGIHDSGMEGVTNMSEKVDLLEKIFSDQREIIKKEIDSNVAKVPQAFIPYKEVLEIYDNGLKLPDDITIVWPDDNYGYIRRLNDSVEQKRSGGSGVYYHLSYWGRPHDYLWLSTTHPMLIWEELQKAYKTGCDRIWVMNVGDIKPAEYNIQLSLDMAYDIKPFSSSQYVKKHLNQWMEVNFGEKPGDIITDACWEYYNLAFERKPEFMGWNQTEPTRVINPTEYNHFNYGDEAQRRLDRYSAISDSINLIKAEIPAGRKDAFYELVYYPVRCAALMNKKLLDYEMANLYAKQNRSSANDFAILAKQAYDGIVIETNYYNENLANGKWKYMMSMNPRNLPVFDCPLIPQWEIPDVTDMGIMLEGFIDERPKQNMYGGRLPDFFTPGDTRFVDLFSTGTQNVDWTATVSQPWILLNTTSGTLTNEFLKKEKRILISINWSKIQPGNSKSGNIVIKGASREFTIPVSVKVPVFSNYKGSIEMNRYISIDAENYSHIYNTPDVNWNIIDGLGYSGKAIMLASTDTLQKSGTNTENFNASVDYEFYSFSKGLAIIKIYCLPSHPLNTFHEMCISVKIDNLKAKQYNYRTYDRSEIWKKNVLSNNAVVQSEFSIPDPGKHLLKITAMDPGIIIDRITIDFGGLQPGYSAIPETKIPDQILK